MPEIFQNVRIDFFLPVGDAFIFQPALILAYQTADPPTGTNSMLVHHFAPPQSNRNLKNAVTA